MLRTGAVLCLALSAIGSPLRDAGAASLEYSVKAAYLTKFGIYVEWPAASFASPSSPLVLCVAGNDPFGAALDQAAAQQRVEGRPVQVKRLKAVTRDAGCHILYLGFSDPQSIGQALAAVHGAPVLTVGDTANADGEIIRFVVENNRVRFDIDEVEASRNGLKISSKLLSLALHVRAR